MVSSGTGVNADVGAAGQWGKTGTTENNGDAWFCGATEDVTACVWVGYADTVTPMETLYNGGPVMGGTFPALIWASVISAWEEIAAERAAETAAEKAAREEGEDGESGESGESEIYVPETETAPVEPEEVAPETEAAPEPEAAPEEAAPAEPAPAARIGRHRRRNHGRLGRRPRHEPRPGGAEAPGAIDRFRDPDPGAGEHLGRGAILGRQDQEGVAGEVGAVVGAGRCRAPRSACRARAEVGVGAVAAPGCASPRGRRSAPGPGSAPPPRRPRARRRS